MKTAIAAAAMLPGQQLPSLAEVAYQQIREGILNGSLKAGEPLGQVDLAARIGTSRVPLREALQRLEAEGLVVLRPRRGYLVASLDPEEIRDIFDIRMMLEERAGYLATMKARPHDVAEVEALLHEMDDMVVRTVEDVAVFAERNRAFHDRIYVTSGRVHLCRLMGVLRANVERYIRIGALIAGNLERVRDDHYRIFEAFRAGDAKAVGRLCRDHCAATCERLLARLAKESVAGTKEGGAGA